jgi:GTP-binding protein
LPGYGFAKVDKTEKIRWGKMMDDYFQTSTKLFHVLHLVDIRHEPTQDDITMNRYFREMGIPFTIVATKADKISRGARMKQLAPICRAMLVQPWEVMVYSSETGFGREELLGKIGNLLKEAREIDSTLDDVPQE